MRFIFLHKKEPCIAAELKGFAGNLLLSHRIAPEVPSPLEGLTAVFGMGTGGSPPLSSPANFVGGSRPMSGGLLRCCPHFSSAYLSTLTSAFGQPPCIPCSLNAHRSRALGNPLAISDLPRPMSFAHMEASLLRKDHSDYRRLLRKPLSSSFASTLTTAQPLGKH